MAVKTQHNLAAFAGLSPKRGIFTRRPLEGVNGKCGRFFGHRWRDTGWFWRQIFI
ncbi:hypothetical protein G7K71_08830 [Desulfofundulus sp. TPOSR]|uniref:hypothetical protein n=1 Tax=Desulfofundulus sp. TPOSR TaxID=2714340 RepID=UPI00140A8629|nr:hypothetical protein [Desulfofundulus sp. TPOSR]NHM27088.1 hypothetical protein [Desulfofundulus sp. TPOSR]